MIEIDEVTGCHRWQGKISSGGYGYLPGSGFIHRLAWERVHGPIPRGMVIDHVWLNGCRYRDCSNIDHLECVTQAMNNLRARSQREIDGPSRRAYARHKLISLGL